jgi:hypothetical protein
VDSTEQVDEDEVDDKDDDEDDDDDEGFMTVDDSEDAGVALIAVPR